MFVVAPDSALRDLGQPALWAFIALVLGGAIAGNLRSVALSTTVTLLVPEEGRDRANGLVGTANGVAFALTSVFSGLAVGQLGMGACVLIAVVRHGPRRGPSHDDPHRGGGAQAQRRLASR